MANVDTNEEFWGITLTGQRKVHTWNPTEAEEDVEHKIQVTQACLGQKAKEGERNVIEVTTEDDDGKKISCTIVSLRVGFAECMHLELGFTNPVRFILKEGNGPISLCGVHLSALPLDFDNNDIESSDDEDGEEVPQLVKVANSKANAEELPDDDGKVEENGVKVIPAKQNDPVPAVAAVSDEKKAFQLADKKNAKKRALPEEEKKEGSAKKKKEESKKGGTNKEAKTIEEVEEVEVEEDDDDDDEDDDEDDEYDKGDEDDEDDLEGFDMEDLDAEDMEDMDSDMESSDDEEDEDEESEEEPPKHKKEPPPKVDGVPPKKLTVSTGKPTPKGKPSANKENININKDVTPKVKADNDGPIKKATTPKKTPEELKTFLLKSANLPKKYEKFSNFLKNNMKVTDTKTQKELWEYVKKNKK